MKIDLEFAELHSPLFFVGKNFGMKLEPKKTAGLKLVYDRAEKELLVKWGARETIVPLPNVRNMTPCEEKVMHIPEQPKRADPELARRGRHTAQVATPTGHVFGGEGAGVTGQVPKAVI